MPFAVKLSNRRRPPLREIRAQLLNPTLVTFRDVFAVRPTYVPGDIVPDDVRDWDLLTLMKRGWVKAT